MICLLCNLHRGRELLSSFLHLSCNELAPFGHYEPLNTNLALEIRDQTTEKQNSNLVNETVFKTFFDITTTTTYMERRSFVPLPKCRGGGVWH